MKKPISTGAHGLIDYIAAGTLVTLPGVLGLSPKLTRALQMIGLKKLIYTMLTQHEMGIIKLIPMKTHLAIDAASGATLCALPFLLDEKDDAAMALCIGMGLNELALSVSTETQPSEDTMIPDVGQKIRRAVKGGTRGLGRAVGANSR